MLGVCWAMERLKSSKFSIIKHVKLELSIYVLFYLDFLSMNETNKISLIFTKHLENTRDWSLIRYWRFYLHLSQSGNMSIFRTHA